MEEGHHPEANVEEDENEQISEKDIAQIYECEGRAEDHYVSDDDEMPGSSNASAMEDEEAVDDSCTALQAHEQDCFAIAVAAHRWLATGGEDDVAYLFDQTKSETEPVLKITHEDSVTQVLFNSSESLLATGDMSGKIVITHIPSLTTRTELNDCNDLEWMTWHSTSDILFAGDKDGMIWMWLIGPKGVVQSKVYPGSGAACSVGQLLPDGKRVLAGYDDGVVRLWQLKEQSSTQLTFNSPITALQHHPTQPVALIGTQKGFVYIINTAQEDSLRRVSEIAPLNDAKTFDDEDEVDQCVECLSFSTSHPWFAVGRNDGSVCVYETNSSSPRSIFRSPMSQAITRAFWTSDGTVPLLVVASVDGTIRIFDSRDGSLFKQLGNGGDGVLDLALVDHSPLRIMTAAVGGIVRVFDLSMF